MYEIYNFVPIFLFYFICDEPIDGVNNNALVATQTHGFSFFQGEAYTSSNPENTLPNNNGTEKPGAGGGYFGGFSGHNRNSGGGGGSSFVLHSPAEIPEGNIALYNGQYTNKVGKPYAFKHKREYFFTNFALVSGIRSGNSFARIT